MSDYYVENVTFLGGSMLDPPFDPAINEYQLARSPENPSRVAFEVKLSHYDDRFEHSCTYSGNFYRGDPFSASRPNALVIPASATDVFISYYPTKRYRDELAGQGRTYTFHVPELVLTAEERAACPHPSTNKQSGECWGGGSGSSQCEVLIVCNRCGTTVDKYYEYND
eukprot:gene7108-5113_t